MREPTGGIRNRRTCRRMGMRATGQGWYAYGTGFDMGYGRRVLRATLAVGPWPVGRGVGRAYLLDLFENTRTSIFK